MPKNHFPICRSHLPKDLILEQISLGLIFGKCAICSCELNGVDYLWIDRDMLLNMKFGQHIYSNDPVFFLGNDWYFWDEVWTHYCGPFESQEIASKLCTRYAIVDLDGGQDPYPELESVWKAAKWSE